MISAISSLNGSNFSINSVKHDGKNYTCPNKIAFSRSNLSKPMKKDLIDKVRDMIGWLKKLKNLGERDSFGRRSLDVPI